MASEFAIIEQYFSDIGKAADNTLLGVGDDAAVVDLPPGQQLVVAMDTLIEGTHFPQDTSPADIAYKSLAVNLSDLAAMGATPAWFLMSLSLDSDDPQWLSGFAGSLKETAEEYGLQLIGGDTCRGKLAISIQIAGHLPNDQFVTRQGAKPGDIILVSGELGNAAMGLAQQQGKLELAPALQSKCALALNRPRPRLELGPFLRRFASSAIDISDGLVGDLKHILKASACGARVRLEALPVDPWIEQHGAWDYALGAGDDYEICCTLPVELCAEVDTWNHANLDCRLTPIGEITESGYYLQDGDNRIDLDQRQGYRHFA